MQKHKIIFGLLVTTLLSSAGGDSYQSISTVESIDIAKCNIDKVYVDKEAKLMWQDQAYTDAEDGAYKSEHSVGKAGTWNHAKNYCNALEYQGYSDWRLPTSDELRYVHHHVGQAFRYHRSDDFWSSTLSTDNRYYVVSPVDAYQYKRKKFQSNYIRCVRCWTQLKKATVVGVIESIHIEER